MKRLALSLVVVAVGLGIAAPFAKAALSRPAHAQPLSKVACRVPIVRLRPLLLLGKYQVHSTRVCV